MSVFVLATMPTFCVVGLGLSISVAVSAIVIGSDIPRCLGFDVALKVCAGQDHGDEVAHGVGFFIRCAEGFSPSLCLVDVMTETLAPSFSCVLSFPENVDHQTIWHPISPVGRFSRLVRGSWGTEEEAHAWAQEKGIHPSTYEVRTF